MLKDSSSSRLFIRTSIFALRSVTPLSIIYCSLRLTSVIPTQSSHTILIADIYCTAESIFYLCIYLPRKYYLSLQTSPHSPLPTRQERRNLFHKLWKCTPNPAAYVSGWFRGVPISSLSREDVKDWILFNLFNKRQRSLLDEDELDEYLAYLESILHHEFPSGRSGNTSTSVVFDPIRTLHRPLIWYILFVSGADHAMFTYLNRLGYHFHRLPLRRTLTCFPPRPLLGLCTRSISPVPEFSYWSLPHTSKMHSPILLLHAIGVGLHFYLPFLQSLRHLHDRHGIGVICIEILPISSRITTPLPYSATTVAAITSILDHHKYLSHPPYLLISHSYGSTLASHLLKCPLTSPQIGSLLFVDPVTFAFHTPNIAYNFLRRNPTTASEWQLYYFASTDFDIAYTLTRRFRWVENSTWREDLEDFVTSDLGQINENESDAPNSMRKIRRRCTVSLSQNDIIACTAEMGKYLTRSTSNDHVTPWYAEHDAVKMEDSWKDEPWTGDKPLEVMWFPGLNHAEVFDTPKDRGRLLRVIERYTVNESEEDD